MAHLTERFVGGSTDGDVVGMTGDAIGPEGDHDVRTGRVQECGHLLHEPVMAHHRYVSVVVTKPDIPVRNPTYGAPALGGLAPAMLSERTGGHAHPGDRGAA